MGKKCSFNKYIKKMCAFLTICLIAITLTSCDSSNRRGTGDLPTEDTYASIADGKYSITVGELYDNLRYSMNSYLENSVLEFLYANEIKEITDNQSKYQERLDDLVKKEIYGVTEDDEIEKLNDKDVKIRTYIDNVKLEGYIISEAEINANDFSKVYPKYYVEVAKYIAAYNKLSEEFTKDDNGDINFGEITNDSYFTKQNVVDHYEANYTNKGDVEAILIRFVSTTEAANLLKAFGIKTYDGSWYQIRLEDDKVTSKAKYDEYYDEYEINPNSATLADSTIEASAKGINTILKIYIALYNYIYSDYRGAITVDGLQSFADYKANEGNDKAEHLIYYYYIQSIITKDQESSKNAEELKTEYDAMVAKIQEYAKGLKENDDMEVIAMSSERLNQYNSSLATYVYDTLKTQAEFDLENSKLDDDEKAKAFTQYSSAAKSYGNYYYLVFKISEVADQELYVENDPDDENDDDDTEITWVDGSSNLLNEILNKLFEAKLNDTYISDLHLERIEDAKIKIFDSIVELQFMQSGSDLASHYHKTKKSNNNLIAEIKYQGNTKEIKVNDAYNELEALHGPQQAMALLFNKYIKDTSYYTDLVDKYDDYVLSIETMLTYFANDYYASYGYPSSLGKYNFMLLYYRTANIETAVRDYLMVSDAQTAFYQDILDNYDKNNNEQFFTQLKAYADASYDKYFSLTATGLNVYVDYDEDGEKDILDPTDDATILAKAEALMKEAQHYIKTSNEDYATAITNLIAEYNDSGRINTDNPTDSDYIWAEYRKEGLLLEKTEIGEVTNTTLGVDEDIVNRIKALYASAMDKKLGLTTNILDDELLPTETGYTSLLITAGKNAASVKFEDEELINSTYTTIPVLNTKDEAIKIQINPADYEADKASLDLIKVYVLDYLFLGDVYSLPTTTITALDTFLLPLIQRYTSSASQYKQILREVGSITFAGGNEVNNAKNTSLQEFITIQQNIADEYNSTQYENWWTTMYPAKSNN